MATFSDLEAQIADDLARSDLTTQIQRAIATAIRAYEHDRFWFNEQRDSTVTLSTSAAFIDLTTLTPTWLHFDRIKRRLDSGSYLDLLPRDYSYIMSSLDTNILSAPYEYTVHSNQLIFDAYALADYTLVLDGIRRISTASASTDASVWFNDARDLIRARAQKELALYTIKDIDLAQAMDAAERLAYSMLKGRYNTLKTTGTIKPVDF